MTFGLSSSRLCCHISWWPTIVFWPHSLILISELIGTWGCFYSLSARIALVLLCYVIFCWCWYLCALNRSPPCAHRVVAGWCDSAHFLGLIMHSPGVIYIWISQPICLNTEFQESPMHLVQCHICVNVGWQWLFLTLLSHFHMVRGVQLRPWIWVCILSLPTFWQHMVRGVQFRPWVWVHIFSLPTFHF